MISKYSLLEDDFEYRGLWWLPSNPERQLSGCVKFTHNEQILLEISVKSGEDDSEYFEVHKLFCRAKPQIIHGVSDTGISITLYKIEEYGENSYVGYRKLRFYVHYIFVGRYFLEPDSLRFSSMQSDLTYLEEWMAPRFHSEYLNGNDGSEDIAEVIIRGTRRKEYEVTVEEIDAKIKIFCGLSEGSKTSTQKHLSYHANLTIEPEESQSFDWFEDKLSKLQNLFTLLIGVPAYSRFVRVCSESASDIHVALGGDVQIFYIAHNSQLVEQIDNRDMLTILPWLENRISTCVKQWFAKPDSLNSIYMLFFSTLIDKSMYLEQKFLSRIQALESFHRKVYGNGAKYISDLEYGSILKILESAIPDSTNVDLRKKLINSLKYGNQLSLRERLQQLIDDCWEGCFEHFVPKKDSFLWLITDTRNYLTHLDDNSKGKVAEGVELYLLNERLKFLLFILFLKELNIPKEDTYNFLKSYKNCSGFAPRFFW